MTPPNQFTALAREMDERDPPPPGLEAGRFAPNAVERPPDGRLGQGWGAPDMRFLRAELPPAPELVLSDVLPPRLARWVANAAEAKGTAPDYVLGTLLATAASLIGNARWVSPWHGWAEPPIIWVTLVGPPSAGKSPAMDAVLQSLREVERPLQCEAEARRKEWAEQAEVAKLAEQAWREAVKAAHKEEKPVPERPDECEAGPPPHVPRLVVNDATIERLGAILALQPRGILQLRDELAGWLTGMSRYSAGGSDRPFWLEAYGGRRFTVERMGRDPVTIDRLAVGVLGGIQPDRLRALLFKADDDGLLARFVPIWPDPPPLRRPEAWTDESAMERILSRLLALRPVEEALGQSRPVVVAFNDQAAAAMQDFRQAVREHEAGTEGLLLSFLGKLPGLAARLSLVLAHLEWASEGGDEPREITPRHFCLAAHLVEAFFLPMARRAYSEAAVSSADRGARHLVAIIREEGWSRFSSRDVLRLNRHGLSNARELNGVLAVLEDGDCIRLVPSTPGPRGGRPPRLFDVNPALLRRPG